jgi:hypothetical protein
MGHDRETVLPVAKRTAVAGAELTLLVLAVGVNSCAAVDLDSGAFVRARTPGLSSLELEPYDVVSARLALDEEPPDPASPEAVALAGLPRPAGRLKRRKALRYLRPLVAPTGPDLLGFLGSSIPYWDLSGTAPSLTLVEPERGLQVMAKHDVHPVWARFQLARTLHNLPATDPRLQEVLYSSGRQALGGDALARALGFHPFYLLVALTQPMDGRCYKTVAAVLPPP